VRIIAYDIDIVEQKRTVLRVIGARSCERWLCNMLRTDVHV